MKRLNDAAKYTSITYPGSGEADKARMSIARVSVMDGKFKEALDVYEAIDKNSDKYAEALDMAGRIRFGRYLQEKKKPEAERNAKQMEEDRLKAVEHFTESVAAVHLKPGEAYPASLLETQLVLAQIHLDAKEFKEARDVVEPFVKVIKTANPDQLNQTMLGIFTVAVRADLGLNDFQKAGADGTILIDIGPDKPEINAVLVNFVLRLDAERKNIQNTLNTLPDSTAPAEAEKIRNNLSSIKTMLGEMLTKLATREQLNPQTMVYIGNLFNDLDMANESEQQYGRVLNKANTDPDFMKDKENAKLLNAVRAKQISVLRKRGKFQEAVDEANKLCTAFPDALEPLVERAMIYQDWAAKDPTKFDNAIGNWTEIRRRLERQSANFDKIPTMSPAAKAKQLGMQQSYYDAIYNTAACLLAQAKRMQATDRMAAAEKAKTGAKVLGSVYQFHPKLDGTEATTKRFAAMKAQLDALDRPAQRARGRRRRFIAAAAADATRRWRTANFPCCRVKGERRHFAARGRRRGILRIPHARASRLLLRDVDRLRRGPGRLRGHAGRHFHRRSSAAVIIRLHQLPAVRVGHHNRRSRRLRIILHRRLARHHSVAHSHLRAPAPGAREPLRPFAGRQ